MTDQPSTQEGCRTCGRLRDERYSRLHGGRCPNPWHGSQDVEGTFGPAWRRAGETREQHVERVKASQPTTQERCPTCGALVHWPHDYRGDPFATTQEAEKALETVQGYISDCCPSCGNDAMTFEGGCDHPWHEADAALRSLRTQHNEQQERIKDATDCYLSERDRAMRAEAELKYAQGGHYVAEMTKLQLQHTKDQERIEELERALDDC